MLHLCQKEKTIGKGFVKKTLPTPKEICTKQLFNAIDILEKTDVDEDGIAPFLPEVFHKLDWLDKEDIIKRFVALEFGRFLKYYANAPQIEESQGRGKSKGKGKDKDTKTRRGKSGSRNGIAEEGYARYFIPLGKKDNIYPKELLGLINKHSKKPIDVGRIDLMKGFAFFEVPEEQASRLEKSMEGASYKGRTVKIERANAKDAGVSMKQGEGKKKRKDKDRPAKKWYDEVSKSHHKPSRKK